MSLFLTQYIPVYLTQYIINKFMTWQDPYIVFIHEFWYHTAHSLEGYDTKPRE